MVFVLKFNVTVHAAEHASARRELLIKHNGNAETRLKKQLLQIYQRSGKITCFAIAFKIFL